MNYVEYLKNPMWINKRRKIILRDGKKCTVCNATKKLQVHHTFYFTDYREPWRYPDESLLTLCKDCHEEHHKWHEHEFKEPQKITRKKRKKTRKQEIKKVTSLKELYKIWEPRLKGKKYKLIDRYK